MLQVISDDYSLDDIINAHRSNLIVIDFYADWCGPCRMIAPFFEQLSEKYSDGVLFLKVNVDLCRQTSISFGVEAMPTFLFLVNGQEVDRIRGANPEALEQKILQYLNAAQSSARSRVSASDEERSFLEKFTNFSRRMIIYEDEIAKTLALSLIPAPKLQEESIRNGEVNSFELLKKLLRWFKTEFFSWVDIPKCDSCQTVPSKDTRTRGSVLPVERRFDAHDVEVYNCSSCSTTVRFPRYNDPTKLLETRKGRCGEWANCFVLCCRAMDFETRWVYDVTDHVWCEVWIKELDRWVHCDPCEAVCDTPLLYERGWGKKLSYIIAFGIDHVRDVTWRYTFNHKEVLKRRTACRESVLRKFLKKLNARYEYTMSEERKVELQRRYMNELVEFLSPNMQVRDDSNVEKQGRITGSEQWKKERGEAGNTTELQTSFIVRPKQSDIVGKTFCFEYSCAKDEYKWGGEVTHGWNSFLYKQKDVFRKEEFDWKMVYLCRKEGSMNGELCWSFDFSKNEVEDIEISVQGMTEYENGKVFATVCAGDSCTLVPKNGSLKLEKLIDGKFDLKITFTGGEGELAWQKAQLFRSEMSSTKPGLLVTAHFV